MKRYFSPSANDGRGAFYSERVHGCRTIESPLSERERKAGKRPSLVPNPDCAIPADAVEVSESRFEDLMTAQQFGLQIRPNNGQPVASKRVADFEERQALRLRERNRRLAASDWTQLPDAPIGDELRARWVEYRQALRDLDMAGTIWPQPPVMGES